MSKEHFVPAQPGYRAWIIFEESGKRYAAFVGEVVAWRMKRTDDSTDEHAVFAAVPILITGDDAAVIEHSGGLQRETSSWPSFEAWVRDIDAIVCSADVERARAWYGLDVDLLEHGGALATDR